MSKLSMWVKVVSVGLFGYWFIQMGFGFLNKDIPSLVFCGIMFLFQWCTLLYYCLSDEIASIKN